MASAVRVLVVAVDRTAARAQAAYVNRVPGFRTAATVGSAAAGLRRLAKGDVDLVLMDRTLPDGDGVALAARLREQGFRGDVILTRAADDATTGSDPLRGIVGELERPFTFEVFRATLSAWNVDHAADVPATASGGPRTATAPAKAPRSGRRPRPGRTALPLGMRPDTLDAITVVLREDRHCEPDSVGSSGAGEGSSTPDESTGWTVSSVATAVGASRLTVRRYLEYLADAGVLARSLRQRAVGRPEALYRPVAQHT